MTDRAQQFWNEQAEFSEATFGKSPGRGPLGPLKHLEKEVIEAQNDAQMLDNRKTGKACILLTTEAMEQCLREELADCAHLLFDAARRAGMTYDQFLDECFKKLEKNKNRKWKAPDENGVCEHVEGT